MDCEGLKVLIEVVVDNEIIQMIIIHDGSDFCQDFILPLQARFLIQLFNCDLFFTSITFARFYNNYTTVYAIVL